MTRKHRKNKRLEENQLLRAKANAAIDPRYDEPPPGAIFADPEKLKHNNTYDTLPKFYIDKAITCRQCGKEEVWPANRQKWWYEEAKGNIFTEAVFCRACRAVSKEKKAEARRIHFEGLSKKQKT
jgi:hypothetical protein